MDKLPEPRKVRFTTAEEAAFQDAIELLGLKKGKKGSISGAIHYLLALGIVAHSMIKKGAENEHELL